MDLEYAVVNSGKTVIIFQMLVEILSTWKIKYGTKMLVTNLEQYKFPEHNSVSRI